LMRLPVEFETHAEREVRMPRFTGHITGFMLSSAHLSNEIKG